MSKINLAISKVPIEKGLFFFNSKGIFILFSLLYTLSSQAQCAMCRASLQSEGNTSKAEAVNDGIVYIMVIPYVLVAVVGVVVYRMYSKNKK
jgi:hypothetical protein